MKESTRRSLSIDGGHGGRQSLKRDLYLNRTLYLLFIPAIFYFVIFRYVPIIGNIIAFMNYRPALGFLKSDWVGLDNFVRFFKSPFAMRTIRNTVVLNVLLLIFEFPAPIIFALLLNEMKTNAYKKTIQTISYLPHFISLVVICGIVQLFVQSTGIVTQIMSFLGLIEPKDLLAEAESFRLVYVLSEIWASFGWSSIIYLATLSNVDVNLYEAAEIDGAGRLRKIWHVTVPALVSVIIVLLIMRIGRIMSMGTEKIILLYRPVTYETADTLSSYVYRVGLLQANYSLGSAVDIFNSIINVTLLVTANKLARKTTGESLF